MIFKHISIIFLLFLISKSHSGVLNRNLDQDHNYKKINGIIVETICDACDLIVPFARDLLDKNKTDEISTIALYLCTDFRIEQKSICKDLIVSYINSVISVAIDSSLTNSELCSAILNCKPINNPVFNWNVTLPNVPKPPVKPPKPPTPSSPVIKILQLTDIHIDFEYQPGALAECDQPLCCRNSSTTESISISKDTKAGYWGDYRKCDIPLWTVENMFDYISKNEQFDYIYWTGDLPPHNVWKQSRDDQLNALDVLRDLFQKYFKNKIVFSSLGNHEATPCNLFPTPLTKQDNISWLYERLAETWIDTGLSPNLKENITRGAFYTLLIYPGVRLISLNMNYCAPLNFWLYINSTDPLDQLKWFVDILQESENKGEKVHVIGHINPSACLKPWSENYYRIVNRYESTIVGQFFGHKHNDYIEMFYDLENITRPTGVAYMAGSTTTYSYLNPSYRIYTIDGLYTNTSWQVLNHETKILNLTDANLTNKPKWIKEYSAKEDYNMTGLYPNDWNNLLDKSLNDLGGNIAKKIVKYYSNSYDSKKICDIRCKKNIICRFKQARPDNIIKC